MNHFLKELYENTTTETLMMSKRDVHVHGLDSYVLRNDNGVLTRVFHVRQNLLTMNYPYSPAYSVGIHDHRYDLTLKGVQGKAISYQFYGYADQRPNDWALWHYQWRTQMNGPATFVRTGLRNVELRSSQELFHGAPRFLSYNVLHTVWAEPGAAWLVQEGRLHTEETNLYTQDSKIDTRGLYHNFDSIDDVRQSFERAFA